MLQLNDTSSKILACDFGTGGLTIGLYDPVTNEVVALGTADYPEMTDLANSRWLEQDPRTWHVAVEEAMDRIREQVDLASIKISGVGIGAHMHALVVLDEQNQPVLKDGKLLSGAIMWNDPRGEEQAGQLADAFKEPIAARMTCSRIKWFAEHFSDDWLSTVHRVTVPSSYIGLEITGEFGVGPGDASGMFGQLDQTGQFAVDKLDQVATNLRDRVPRVGCSGDVLGRLNRRGAELFKLPEGIPVAFPEGDQPVGMVASGCLQPGQASVSLGNSVVFNAVGNAPILDQRGVIDSFRTAMNLHLLMTCVTSGCAVYDELVECFSPLSDKTVEQMRDWLAEQAASVPPGCNGVLALPFYLGEGVYRQPNAFAAFLGLRANGLRAGVLARASMEANSLIMRCGYDQMGLSNLGQIVLSGGGSKNPVWPQIIADVFQVPVGKPEGATELGVRGAAYLALHMAAREEGQNVSLTDVVADRVRIADQYEPNIDNKTVYEDMLPVMQESLQQLVPLYENPWFQAKVD